MARVRGLVLREGRLVIEFAIVVGGYAVCCFGFGWCVHALDEWAGE